MMNETLNIKSEDASPTKYRSYKVARLISKIAAYTLLAILAIIWIYPLLWVIVCSFTQAPDGTPTIVPAQYFPRGKNYSFGFQNYINLSLMPT